MIPNGILVIDLHSEKVAFANIEIRGIIGAADNNELIQ